VAADAFRIFVLSNQWIFGLLVMVENDFFPALFVMAGFAFGTEVTLVFVVFLVAGQTIHL